MDCSLESLCDILHVDKNDVERITWYKQRDTITFEHKSGVTREYNINGIISICKEKLQLDRHDWDINYGRFSDLLDNTNVSCTSSLEDILYHLKGK